jgi:hypothetical protein
MVSPVPSMRKIVLSQSDIADGTASRSRTAPGNVALAVLSTGACSSSSADLTCGRHTAIRPTELSRPENPPLLPFAGVDRVLAGTARVGRSAATQKQRAGSAVSGSILGRTVRPPLSIFDFKALLMALKREPDLPIVARCSYCRRLRRPGAGDDDWVSAETYYRLGGTNRVRISHGLCADCDAVRFPER